MSQYRQASSLSQATTSSTLPALGLGRRSQLQLLNPSGNLDLTQHRSLRGDQPVTPSAVVRQGPGRVDVPRYQGQVDDDRVSSDGSTIGEDEGPEAQERRDLAMAVTPSTQWMTVNSGPVDRGSPTTTEESCSSTSDDSDDDNYDDDGTHYQFSNHSGGVGVPSHHGGINSSATTERLVLLEQQQQQALLQWAQREEEASGNAGAEEREENEDGDYADEGFETEEPGWMAQVDYAMHRQQAAAAQNAPRGEGMMFHSGGAAEVMMPSPVRMPYPFSMQVASQWAIRMATNEAGGVSQVPFPTGLHQMQGAGNTTHGGVAIPALEFPSHQLGNPESHGIGVAQSFTWDADADMTPREQSFAPGTNPLNAPQQLPLGQGGQAEPQPGQPVMDDEDYEPSETEIREYCDWLGLNPATERQLVWIAREALKAPLPENWRICYTDDGEVYYFNIRTGESIWDHPMDAYYKALFRQEKVKLDQKKKHMRLFSGSRDILPLADFFSDAVDDDEEPPDAPWKTIPETLIDAIDFRIYVQPVVLPTSGRTVSRHTIILNKWRDPFSREYVENRRLVPNVDKRTEVDSWLTKVSVAYLNSLVPTVEGLKRLVKILPFFLDKEEEVCVRAQQLLLGWIKKHLTAATVAAAPTTQPLTLPIEEKRPPPATEGKKEKEPGSGRSAGPGSGRASSKPPPPSSHGQDSARRRLNNTVHGAAGAAAASAARSSQGLGSTIGSQRPQAGAGGKGKDANNTKDHNLAKEKSNGGVVASQDSQILPPPMATAAIPSGVTSPPVIPPLIDGFKALDDAATETLVSSLLTMSSSSGREMLLLCTMAVPSLLAHKAFYGFSEEVLNVLHLSVLDLSRIAATLLVSTTTVSNSSSSTAVSTEHRLPPPTPTPGPSTLLPASPPTGNQQQNGSSSFPEPGQAPAVSPRTRLHLTVANEDHTIALKWAANLMGAPGKVNVLKPLDFVAAEHIVLAMFCANGSHHGGRKEINTNAVALPKQVHDLFAAETLLELLQGTEGWPMKLGSCPDDHVSLLLELGLHISDPEVRIKTLFELAIHSGERSLATLKLHADRLITDISEIATKLGCNPLRISEDAPSAPDAAARLGILDRFAGVLVFHEVVRLADFKNDLSLLIRVGINLVPRLTRSQWKPRHFHDTLSLLVESLQSNILLAGSIITSQQLLLLLKELSRKKNTSDEVRQRLESIEASERQLQSSNTLNNWTLIAARLKYQQELRQQQLNPKELTPQRYGVDASLNDISLQVSEMDPSTPPKTSTAIPNPRNTSVAGATSTSTSSKPAKGGNQNGSRGTKLPALGPPKKQVPGGAPMPSSPVKSGPSSTSAQGTGAPAPDHSTDSANDVPIPVALTAHTRTAPGERKGTPDNVEGFTAIQWINRCLSRREDIRKQRGENAAAALGALMSMRLKPKAQPPPPRGSKPGSSVSAVVGGSGTPTPIGPPKAPSSGRMERRGTPSTQTTLVAAAELSERSTRQNVSLPPIH